MPSLDCTDAWQDWYVTSKNKGTIAFPHRGGAIVGSSDTAGQELYIQPTEGTGDTSPGLFMLLQAAPACGSRLVRGKFLEPALTARNA